jgi:cobalamin biosynthesis protein CobD/CbiB
MPCIEHFLGKRWERIRIRGKIHFVVLYGMLGWGLLTGTAAMLLWIVFVQSSFTVETAARYLVVFPLLGVILALDTYERLEKRCQERGGG